MRYAMLMRGREADRRCVGGARPLGTVRVCGIVGAFCVTILSGCAAMIEDRGMSAVQDLVKASGAPDVRWARTEADVVAIEATVGQILARPLSVDDAVQIALINSRGLQATYAEVGISETEVVEASWPRNPGFSSSHLAGGGEKEIERSFTVELVSLLTIPMHVHGGPFTVVARDGELLPPQARFDADTVNVGPGHATTCFGKRANLGNG